LAAGNAKSCVGAQADWRWEIQVRYAATEIAPTKSARARGSYLRVSFKNTRETAQAINGWKLQRALTFLQNVIDKKEAVPMRRYAGSTGRTAQGTNRNLAIPLRALEDLEEVVKGGMRRMMWIKTQCKRGAS